MQVEEPTSRTVREKLEERLYKTGIVDSSDGDLFGWSQALKPILSKDSNIKTSDLRGLD